MGRGVVIRRSYVLLRSRLRVGPGSQREKKMGFSEASESIAWIVSLTDSRVFRVHHHRRPPSPAA